MPKFKWKVEVSIFKECQPEFLHDLVLKMKAYIFTPGDLICRKGEVAREMFIIADGILEVISINIPNLNKAEGFKMLLPRGAGNIPHQFFICFSSETGKVLTTMKAGDFFGEIGILNLDGLNKRTADVRSVGYSELFSLSREDVLTAMKDYPEAQEILQSLGRKRLMEARHQASKSGSSGSSKRGTPSPNRDGGLEDKNAKRIVSRIRSDVSAIRNAFRRSKGTTRDNETMELEPLTGDHRSSPEDDGPAVKRILKKISGRSGSDSSGGGARGVLKRMARVTSDETNQVVSPGRTSSNEEQGVLGAGLPLLQRLKLLKEKEEKEDRERQRIKEEEEKQQEAPPKEEEPEVIGAGLPLFARLRLLKAKEEKEKMEREEKEKTEKEKANKEENKEGVASTQKDIADKVVSPVKDQPTKPSLPSAPTKGEGEATAAPQPTEVKPRLGGGLLKNKLRAAILSKAAPPSSGTEEAAAKPEPVTTTTPTITTSTTTSQATATIKQENFEVESNPQVKSPINDLNKGVDSKSGVDGNVDKADNNNSIASKDIHANSNSVQSGDVLEKAFGKLLSKKLNTAPKERTSSPVIEKSAKDVLKLPCTTTKDKINRSDSFKKAMDEGLFKGTEGNDLNIKPSDEAGKVDPGRESDNEEPQHAMESRKDGESQSENELSPVSDAKQIVEKQDSEEDRRKSIDKTAKSDEFILI
ncbi:hypothetical protein SK128_015277 [Halocaridina rubra]|uniref:Cyclic nucleotide-binding domain-containing protein n=1 Tax=Halocaridina rubra TaxID=373956 RepID=A0AAN8XHJ7_HALRR